MKSISPLELHQKLAGGGPLRLIDVRTPREFAKIHIPGAASHPVESLDPGTLTRQLTASPSAPLYVVCQSGTRAKKAIHKLEKAGVGDCVLVEGGTQAWMQAGLPIERLAVGGISLERQVRIAAGALVLAGTLLGVLWHSAFLGLPAFVGAGLVFAGVTDICGMGMLLARMPWNQVGQPADACQCSH